MKKINKLGVVFSSFAVLLAVFSMFTPPTKALADTTRVVSVVSISATSITTNSAKLTATVNTGRACKNDPDQGPYDQDGVYFVYGPSYQYSSPRQNICGTTDITLDPFTWSNLQPDTTYSFKLSTGGTYNPNWTPLYSEVITFRTLPIPVSQKPSATALQPTFSSYQGKPNATFKGTVNPNGLTTSSIYFKLSNGLNYGMNDETLSGSSDTPVSTLVTGLTCGQSYSYQLVVSNPGGTTTSNTINFTFGSAPSSSAMGCYDIVSSSSTPQPTPTPPPVPQQPIPTVPTPTPTPITNNNPPQNNSNNQFFIPRPITPQVTSNLVVNNSNTPSNPSTPTAHNTTAQTTTHQQTTQANNSAGVQVNNNSTQPANNNAPIPKKRNLFHRIIDWIVGLFK